MIKSAGAVLLFLSCCGMGFWKSQQCTGRIRQLRELMRIAGFLKGEISFARTTLPEALDRIAKKTGVPFSKALSVLAARLVNYAGEDFSCILEQTMGEMLENTYLEKEDREEFYQAFCDLGYLDKEMQVHLLERYLKEQEEKVKMLTEELPEKRKLCKSMGILGGAFLVILLL